MGVNSYSDGTISIASGSAALVGVGTAWSTQVKPGDPVRSRISTGGSPEQFRWVFVGLVESVDSDTTITLQDEYEDEALSGDTYRIARSYAWWTGAAPNETLVEFLTELGPYGLAGITTGEPDPDEGRDNELRVSTTTGVLYQKQSGSWVAIAGPAAASEAQNDSNIPGATVADALDALAPSLLGGWRNLLINPDGRINQRALASNADDTYGHDRWYALTQTGTIAVSTAFDAENGTPRMWRLTQSQASAQRMGYAQIIEGANCRHLRGKNVTLSGRIKFSLAAAVRYAILEWTGTEDAVTSDVVAAWTNGAFTAGQFFNSTTLNVLGVGTITPSAAALTDLTTLTAAVGSSCNNLIVFFWTEGATAQNAILDGALQLEAGSVASQREFRPIGVELEWCQRYLPVFLATVITEPIGNGQCYNTTDAACVLPFFVQPRIAPTGVTVSAAGHLSLTQASTTQVPATGATFFGAGLYAGYLGVTGASGLVAGNVTALTFNNVLGRIYFTGCEL